MYDNLREAIENSEAEADPAVRILVVASTGDNFTNSMHSSPSGRKSSAGRLLRTLWFRTGGSHGTSILILDPPTNCGKPR